MAQAVQPGIVPALPFPRARGRIAGLFADAYRAITNMCATEIRPEPKQRNNYPPLRASFIENAAMRREMHRL